MRHYDYPLKLERRQLRKRRRKRAEKRRRL